MYKLLINVECWVCVGLFVAYVSLIIDCSIYAETVVFIVPLLGS